MPLTDDYTNDISTTGTIIIPSTVDTPAVVTGSIESEGDTDWFAVNLTEGNTYIFTVDGSAVSVYSFNFYDDQANQIDSTWIPLGGAFTAKASGTYYVEFAGYSIGDYTIYASQYQDDYGDDIAGASPIGIADTVNTPTQINGVLGIPNDTDWFSVDLKAGQTYLFSTQGTDTILSVYNINETGELNMISNYINGGLFTAENDGSYFLSANYYYTTGKYTLSASLYQDDYAGDASTTGVLVLPAEANMPVTEVGTIGSYDDADWFAVELQAGKSYHFSADNHYPTIYDANSDTYFYSGVITPKSTGTYYVAVNSVGYVGNYTLEGVQYTDDYVDNTSTTGIIVIDSEVTTVTGSAEVANDIDWFAVNLTAGQSYYFTSQNTDGSYTANLQLFDSNGKALNYDYFTYAERTFTVNTTGTYYLAATGYNSDYSVSAQQYTDDYANIIDLATLVASPNFDNPVQIDGSIEIAQDKDVFQFSAQAGAVYSVSSNNEGLLITVLSEQGETVVYSYGGESAFIVPNSGTYYVTTESTYYNNVTDDYSVILKQVEDDYTNDVNTSGLVVIPETVETPVSVTGDIDFLGDEDWFAVELQAGTSYNFNLSTNTISTSDGIENKATIAINPDESLVVIDPMPPIGFINNLNLSVNNAEGKSFISSYFSGNLNFTPYESGTYYLSVSGYTTNTHYTLTGKALDHVVDTGNNDPIYIDIMYGDFTMANANDTLYGSINANKLYAGGGNDELYGASNADTLDGGTGNDSMQGGEGNDTYIVDSTGDMITEISVLTDEIDQVISSVNYQLGDNLEQLRITGLATHAEGNALNNLLQGNRQDNVLYGMAGNDRLIGYIGADLFVGGADKDVLNLTETTASTDTVKITAGDSTIKQFDVVKYFALGHGNDTAGVDKLDLQGAMIAENTTADGINQFKAIRSHSITDGIVQFDNSDQYDSPVNNDNLKLGDIAHYLEKNLSLDGETVAFIRGGNTFVFQHNTDGDTLVQLTGIIADSLDNTGLSINSVWVI